MVGRSKMKLSKRLQDCAGSLVADMQVKKRNTFGQLLYLYATDFVICHKFKICHSNLLHHPEMLSYDDSLNKQYALMCNFGLVMLHAIAVLIRLPHDDLINKTTSY